MACAELGVGGCGKNKATGKIVLQLNIRPKKMVDLNELLSSPHPLLLFDGECNLCNGSVRFLIERNSRANIRFASLQSGVGRVLLRHFGLPEDELGSIVLVEGGRCFQSSGAALRLCRHMDGAWRLCSILLLVPRFLRDAVYGFVARRRYRWFGKADACMMPTPALRARFLDT